MSELGDLLELMHTARGRCHALRMAIRVWEDPGATRDAAGAVGNAVWAATGEGRRPVEREDRLWYSAPDRARLETGPSPSGARLVSVTDGPVRISRLGDAAAVRETVVRFREVAFGEHGALLDPAPLAAVADLEGVGRAVAAGREGIVARARIRRDLDPLLLAPPPWVDELEVVVDAACGILLLQVTRAGGRALRVVEVTGVEVDGYIPPERFAYAPAEGEVVRDRQRPTPPGA